ncbi:MAG TPA: GNAT family N-acetyltransferase [Solirubrobacterales bacterium]|jgi:GNAT superfamily N-acetyltransferase
MSVPTDDAAWLDLVRSSMPPFWRLLAEGCGGWVHDEDEVFAAIVPASPRRSFFNSVLYSDPERLLGRLDSLAEAYADAGVTAWTVWVPEADTGAIEGLEAAGHRLDATPTAMAMPIGDLRAPAPDPELEIREEPGYELVSQMNEVAYGFAPGDFPVITGDPAAMRTYIGYRDGEPIGCAGAFTHGTDCELVYVAVLPEGRGRGVSARLCARALADAREQGLQTTTLQATKLGYPVYERLGYRDYGELQMWERRAG